MRRRALPTTLMGLAALGAALLPCPAPAAGRAVEITGVRVGLADCYKLGLWTPIRLGLRSDRPVAGRVEIVVPDGDGVPVRYATACKLAPGRETTATVYAQFGRPAAAVEASFVAGAERLARRVFPSGAARDGSAVPTALGLDEHLFLMLGSADMGLEEAVRRATSSGWEARLVRLADLGALPDRWYGYEGVDLVAISTTRPELFAELDAARAAALDAWLGQGGEMLLSAGAEAEKALGASAPLARFAPGRVTGVVSLRQTEALETYCQSPAPVPRALEHGVLRAARLADVRGTVEAREADLPLVVREARGFGRVVFLAADLDRAPLAQWAGRPLLLERLLDLPGAEEEARPTRTMMHYGFVDIAGQLRAALEHFPGVRLMPFWVVAALIVVYVALIGPVDYFVLRRFSRRMVLTWITFPATVVVVGAVACLLAVGLKGDRVHASQADLVEVDAASGLVRGTTWAVVFSPRPDVYDLSLRPRLPGGGEPQQAATLMSWLGMPGRGLGGMAPQAAVPAVWPKEYRSTDDLARLVGVPVPAWATKGITARWTGQAQIDLEASLAEQGQMLEGTLTNTLGVDLEGCLLVHDRWAYDLGDLPAGRTALLGTAVKRSELSTYLTGRKIVFDDTRSRYEEEVPPYNLGATPARQILRTMMFFQAAGGTRYTGLVDNYQGFVDASGLMKTDRAMLVGFVAARQAARTAPELLRGDRALGAPGDAHTVAVRIVLPIPSSRR